MILPTFVCVVSYVQPVICCVMQNDRTPLFWTSLRGYIEIVAMLLKFHADFSSCRMVSTSYYISLISTVSE